MTNLIIHTDLQLRRAYLLNQVNELLGTEYSQVAQLYTNPDIHIIEQPEHVSIKIEDVKLLQKEMLFKPFSAKYQIGIIFHSKMLTVEAQNALLKTLEEQSENTIYYLLVNSEQSVLPTIVSRSIKHYVNIQSEGIKPIEVSETPDILQVDTVVQFQKIEELVEDEKENKGSIQDQLNLLSQYQKEQLEKAIDDGDMKELSKNKEIIEAITKSEERLRANVNKRLLLENLLLQIRKISTSD